MTSSSMILLLLLLSSLTGLQGSNEKFKTTLNNPFYLYGEPVTEISVSFSEDTAYLCMNGFYQKGSESDCLLLSGTQRKDVNFGQIGARPQSLMQPFFPKVKSPLSSRLKVKLTVSDIPCEVGFYSMGKYAGLLMVPVTSTLPVSLLLKGKEVKLDILEYFWKKDLSGCRAKDGGSLSPEEEKTLSACEKETCPSPGKSSVTTSCGSNERCISGSCKYRATCTFTGSSVIDSQGGQGDIKDRCDYRLMEAKLLPDFSVQGTYGERRRKDVSFLNTVALKLKTSTIHLGQGGRVTEGDTVLTLTEEKKVVGKVALVRTAAGVTATYSDQSFEVVVFFNGYTAQIDITGPPSTDLGLKHLCANAASPEADVRATTGSCETKHQDDPPISCDKSKSSCGILKDAPFTSCHSHVKPDAFVTACSNMMCRYPAVDELTCNFLEAYTRACSLYSTTAVMGWRSKASCPESPKALCQDMPCGSQEFCGQLEGGSWSCLCRPIFTQQYRDSGSLGDATTCGAGSASASLINCLLEEKGIDYTTLRLKDKTCKGELIDGMAVFKFDNSKPCGAKVTRLSVAGERAVDLDEGFQDNNGAVNYKNHIQSKEMPADGIIHHSPVDIPFACDFAEPKLQLMSFKVSSSSSVVNKPVESGSYEYGITMKAFSNEARTEDLKSVGLNQRIWIELKATGVDSKMVSVLFDSCWATKKADPESNPKYYLVSGGCRNPEDPSVLLDGNGAGTLSVFSFMTFQFTDSKSEVFLHCKVKMCSKKKDKTCVPDCKSRKRRSLDAAADSSLLTMSWAASSD